MTRKRNIAEKKKFDKKTEIRRKGFLQTRKEKEMGPAGPEKKKKSCTRKKKSGTRKKKFPGKKKKWVWRGWERKRNLGGGKGNIGTGERNIGTAIIA